MFNFCNYFNFGKNYLYLLCILTSSTLIMVMYLWTVSNVVPNSQGSLLQQYQKLCDLHLYNYCHHSSAKYNYAAYLKSFAQVASGANQRNIPKEIVRLALSSVEHSTTSEESNINSEILDYLFAEINAEDVAWLLEQYQHHQAVISDIADYYQVNPYILGAIWLLDSTDFSGKKDNVFSYLIASLNQLSFSYEVESKIYAAMEIIMQKKLMPSQLLVGVTGHLGSTHFSPQEYLDYAIDVHQDGMADIWNNSQETLASIANYLNKNGWDNHLDIDTYGVITPASFSWDINFHNLWNCQGPSILVSDGYLLSEWADKSMIQDNKSLLPNSKGGDVFYFLGNKLDRIGNQWHGFLVNKNYFIIMQYACSVRYALKVSLIAKILSTLTL